MGLTSLRLRGRAARPDAGSPHSQPTIPTADHERALRELETRYQKQVSALTAEIEELTSPKPKAKPKIKAKDASPEEGKSQDPSPKPKAKPKS